MTAILPESSDTFSYSLAKAINFVDYHPRSFIRQVDAMQALAVRLGLVERKGQDWVQHYMAAAFRHVRRRR